LTVRIVVAEPSELIRKAIRAILPAGFVITHEVGSAIAALREVGDSRPEMLVAAYSLPKTDGLTFIRAAVSMHPLIRILLLSDGETDRLQAAAVRAGVAGIVSKDQSEEIVRAAILQVGSGGKYLCGVSATAIANDMRRPLPIVKISDRESEVLRMLSNGLGNKEIAKALVLSPHTIVGYRKSLMRKLDCSNVVELLAAASLAHLLDQRD
jgi:DNA-binding NarL/FixJ family response regulator